MKTRVRTEEVNEECCKPTTGETLSRILLGHIGDDKTLRRRLIIVKSIVPNSNLIMIKISFHIL